MDRRTKPLCSSAENVGCHQHPTRTAKKATTRSDAAHSRLTLPHFHWDRQRRFPGFLGEGGDSNRNGAVLGVPSGAGVRSAGPRWSVAEAPSAITRGATQRRRTPTRRGACLARWNQTHTERVECRRPLPANSAPHSPQRNRLACAPVRLRGPCIDHEDELCTFGEGRAARRLVDESQRRHTDTVPFPGRYGSLRGYLC